MLEEVTVENFRCIRAARLEFDPRATMIVGDNGSGKSSLLEAIYLLGSGRSFRGGTRDHLLAHGADFFRVVAQCRSPMGGVAIGADFQKGRSRFRIGGRAVRSVAQLAELLPVQVIDPGIHRIVEEGSARRRRLLDWGVFHVKHDFLPNWRRYQRALNQRNAALRSGARTDVVTSWDQELATTGSLVHEARREYFGRMLPHFRLLAQQLMHQSIDLDFFSGWRADVPLGTALAAAQPRDRRLRFTTVGPHRADLRLSWNGSPARDHISRGEQKMISVALILAQVRCIAAATSQTSCLLLDDPAAELDVDNLGKLLAAVESLQAQLIVTGVQSGPLRPLPMGRMFHVKQGHFEPVL